MLSRVIARSTNSALHRSSRFFSSGTNGVLVVADHDNSSLGEFTLSSVAAANQLGGASVSVLVAGNNCRSVVDAAAKLDGVTNVIVAESADYEHGVAENMTTLLGDLQKEKQFSHIVTSSTASGRNFIPRLAALLDVAPITDVIGIKSADTFVRPIYAGNALCTVQSEDSVKLMTVRPPSFPKSENAASAPVPEESFSSSTPMPNLSTWVSDDIVTSERPELGTARVVVSGGRGLKSGENFALLESLADCLGGAVGASRAAVDAGFVPNDMQIGQTGKVVAPDLYIACGISGAIQHLAGMKDSKVIVAINKDPEAPIFQVADYGIVGDLFTVVPELNEKLAS